MLINSIEAGSRSVLGEVAEQGAEDTILADKVLPDARFVTVKISDDGGGIGGEAAAQIFDLGFTTKSHYGSGIGMTLARLLARQAGGEIELRSRGAAAGDPRTEFVLLLPLEDREAGTSDAGRDEGADDGRS